MRVPRAKTLKQCPQSSKFKCCTVAGILPQVIPQLPPADRDVCQVSKLWQSTVPTPPDTCVLPAAHLWQAGSRTIGAWPTRPLVVAAKGPGSQGPNNAMPSALDFMPLLQALLGQSLNCKATNTPITLTGEPLLSCLILPTFWCKRCCWLRPAFPQRWEQERLSWGQNEEPWGPAELLSSWGAWGVCFRGHMPLMSSLLPQGAIAKT